MNLKDLKDIFREFKSNWKKGVLWLFILVVLFVIGVYITGFVDEKARNRASAMKKPSVVKGLQNTVLRIRPDDNNIVVPSLSDQTQNYIILPLILWCDQGQTCDLDGIIMQKFDNSLGQFVGLASSLTDQNGNLISFPLRITDKTKILVILRFPMSSVSEPKLKVKVRFVGYEPEDTTMVDVEIERQRDGYRGMVMSHERLYNFGRLPGPQKVEFLKPYREIPDVMIRQ